MPRFFFSFNFLQVFILLSDQGWVQIDKSCTYLRTLATLHVLFTSSLDSLLCEKAGMFNLTRVGNSKSRMVKPVTSSPGTNLFKILLPFTMNLSLAHPLYALEMCMISPHGAMETQCFTVLWDL